MKELVLLCQYKLHRKLTAPLYSVILKEKEHIRRVINSKKKKKYLYEKSVLLLSFWFTKNFLRSGPCNKKLSCLRLIITICCFVRVCLFFFFFLLLRFLLDLHFRFTRYIYSSIFYHYYCLYSLSSHLNHLPFGDSSANEFERHGL